MANDRLAVIQAAETEKELRKIEAVGKEVITMFKEMVTQTGKINRAFNSGKLREYTEALKNLNQQTAQYTTLERQLAEAMARTARLEREQARLNTENARTRRELAEAERAESRAREQSNRESRNQARQSRDSASAHRQLTLQVREARQRARDYGAEMINLRQRHRDGAVSSQDFARQMAELRRKFKESTSEAIRLERQLRNLNQSTLPSNQRNGALAGRVSDIIKGVGLLSIAQSAMSSLIGAAQRMGTAFYETAVKLETLRFAQKAVFKTNEEVARQNKFLTETAERYGLEILSLTQAYNQFSASAQGTTLEGEKSKEIFDAVAKSSAMLGVSTEDTNGVLRALGQMMSKGKVQAEELRGQLGDRMAGAFRLFADGMGVSTAELDKMLKDGKVITEEVLPKFAAELNKKYQLGIEGVDTKQADIARIKNEWTDFVDAVENKSGIVAGGINMATNAIVSLLQALKPSKEVTVIEQQQLKLNELAVQLQQNWKDEKQRKDIINEMISINPFFLSGLEKEKVTLEDIAKRIQDVNLQYIQKIALQEQEDKIKELLKDQALNYRDLGKIISDNAIAYNALSLEARNTLTEFSRGAVDYDKAYASIISTTRAGSEERRKALYLLKEMNLVFEKETWHGFNRVRGIKDTNAALKGASIEYNNLVKATNSMLGVQGQLIHMNGLTAQSFNNLGVAIKNSRKAGMEQILAAQGRGDKHVLVNNVWRSQNKEGKWFTTNKKETEGWYMENGELVKRKPATIPEKATKPKTAALNSTQKDFIMEAQGVRDNEIAAIKKRRLDLKIDDEEYWKEYEKIIVNYSNKIANYLNGSNAKARQIEGQARKKAIEAQEQAVKEIYDFKSKRLEGNFKKESNIIERESKNLEQNQTINDVERLSRQIAFDGKMIDSLNSYYEDQIKLAANSAQSVIEWERKRDEEIGKIEDERLKRLNSLPEAYTKVIENESSITQSKIDSNFEDQKALILKDKKLSADQRAFKLSQLEKDLQIEKNKQEIKRLGLLKAQILAQQIIRTMKGQTVTISPEEEKALKEYEATIKNLEGSNSQLGAEKESEIAPEWNKTKELLVKGLQDLGMNNLSEQIGNNFDELYKKIVSGALTTKDAVILASAALADALSSMVTRQKDKTIESLNEQLKYTQESTEQELDFINSRLEALNSLEELTAEQMAERNRLEDEARATKQQQLQQERMIEAQKARAEQKASAQQALINGALGASLAIATYPFPASLVPAALSLAFGVAQSVAIMSKDPVPQYFKGRPGGKAEYAWTQEKGAEIIADKNKNIKSLGSSGGAKMTWLDEGDIVYTADQSKEILKTLGPNPKIGMNLFRKVTEQSLTAPHITVMNNYIDNSDAIARKVTRGFGQELARYTHPTTEYTNGKVIRYTGANHGVVIGYYDEETLKPIKRK